MPSAVKMSSKSERISGSSSTTSRVAPAASRILLPYPNRGGTASVLAARPRGLRSGLLLEGLEDAVGLDRHLPDPRPGSGEDGVGERGPDGGRAGFAHASGIFG